jgi:hypothetical protein
MKRAVQRFVILDMVDGEYGIIFRDPAYFKKTLRALVADKYQIFQRDDRGKNHLVKAPQI